MGFDTTLTLTVIHSANIDQEGVLKGFDYQKSQTVRKIIDEVITLQVGEEQMKGVLVSDNIGF